MRDIIIVHMPRSGSNLLQDSICQTYKHHGIFLNELDEYFLSHAEIYQEWNNRIIKFMLNEPIRNFFNSKEDFDRFYYTDLDKKFELYQKYMNQGNILKISFNRGFNETIEFLNGLGQSVILLDRRDKTAQLCSYLMAKKTDLWNMNADTADKYISGYQKVDTVEITSLDIFNFVQDCVQFDSLTKDCNVIASYKYEDIVTNLSNIVLDLTGYSADLESMHDKLPMRISTLYDKSKTFSNYEPVQRLLTSDTTENLSKLSIDDIRSRIQ